MPEFVQLLTSVGVAGVLAAWLWTVRQERDREREERIKIQAKYDELAAAQNERVIKAITDVGTAQSEQVRSNAAVIELLRQTGKGSR